MKKNVRKLSLLVAVVIISAYCYLTKEKDTVEALLFDNIEALASGEGGSSTYHCFGWGNVNCYGNKVEYMIDGIDLD